MVFMEAKLARSKPQQQAQGDRPGAVRFGGRLAIATGALLVASCGGGGEPAPEPKAASTPSQTISTPLVWDQTEATWNNANWQ
jgi:hypothetical protein